jgi:hypothetical protein
MTFIANNLFLADINVTRMSGDKRYIIFVTPKQLYLLSRAK